MVFCLLVFASPGSFTELGSADGKPLSATSAPTAGCVIHTLVYYITFSPCAQLFCPVSAEKLTCFRRIPFSSPMLFYRLIVFNGRGVSQRFAHGTPSIFMGGGSFAPPCTPLSCPCRTDLSSVQKTPHLFSDGQTGGSSARTLLFQLPGQHPRDFPAACAAQAYVSRSTASTTKRSSSPPVQVESVTILSSVPMDTSHSISEFRCAHWTSSSRSSRAAGTR